MITTVTVIITVTISITSPIRCHIAFVTAHLAEVAKERKLQLCAEDVENVVKTTKQQVVATSAWAKVTIT